VRQSVLPRAGALAALVLAGCTGPAPSPSSPPSSPPTSSGPTATAAPGGRLTSADAARCPVTRPRSFSPPPGVSPGVLFGASSAHGNAQLWVGGLGEDGIIAAGPEPDGSIGMKFGWYRITPGRLVITGRRLDGAAPPARASVPDGYGDSGFQSTGVTFPTPGCWEVTGTVGPTATLTFVTFVIEG